MCSKLVIQPTAVSKVAEWHTAVAEEEDNEAGRTSPLDSTLRELGLHFPTAFYALAIII